MPEYVVTVTKRIRCTAEVTVRAEDEDAAWEKVEDAFGEELEALVEAGDGPRRPSTAGPGRFRVRRLPPSREPRALLRGQHPVVPKDSLH